MTAFRSGLNRLVWRTAVAILQANGIDFDGASYLTREDALAARAQPRRQPPAPERPRRAKPAWGSVICGVRRRSRIRGPSPFAFRRAPATAHRDVLRPGGVHRAVAAPRPGGAARRAACLRHRLLRRGDALRRHIAQDPGDALMIYFGWPRAHEDDAERVRPCGARDREGGQEQSARANRSPCTSASPPGVVVVGGAAWRRRPRRRARGRRDAEPRGPAPGHRRANEIVIEARHAAPRRQHLRAHRPRRAVAQGFGECARCGAWKPSAVPTAASILRTAERRSAHWSDARRSWRGCCCEWQLARSGAGRAVFDPRRSRHWQVAAGRGAARDASPTSPTPSCATSARRFHVNAALHPVIAHLELAAGFARDDSARAETGEARTSSGRATGRRVRRRCSRPCCRCPPIATRRSDSRRSSRKRRTLEVLIEPGRGAVARSSRC